MSITKSAESKPMPHSKATQDPSPGQLLSNREAYVAMIQMIIQIENISWTRLYNFLMGSSILVLAQATVYASAPKSASTTTVLVSLGLIGALAGPAWAKLGVRARSQLELVYNAARRLENKSTAWETSVLTEDLPMNIVCPIRDTSSIFSSNPFLLKWAPLSFTALNLVLLLAAVCR